MYAHAFIICLREYETTKRGSRPCDKLYKQLHSIPKPAACVNLKNKQNNIL